jgi:hypothetical protein
MELFSICEWSNFMLSRAVIIMVCVYLCMCACIFYNKLCVLLLLFLFSCNTFVIYLCNGSHRTLLVQYSITIASMSFLLILYEIWGGGIYRIHDELGMSTLIVYDHVWRF